MSWLDDFYRIVHGGDHEARPCPYCNGMVRLRAGRMVSGRECYRLVCDSGHPVGRWHTTAMGAWRELDE